MRTLHTPGVYFEWQDSRLGSGITLARADVTGFVGIAERGPVGKPVRVTSWNQFTSAFGDQIAAGFLACGVEGFFDNGGQRCWIIRVASDKASAASFTLTTAKGEPSFTLRAASPGTWGNQLAISATPSAEGLFDLTLRLPNGTEEVWRNLSTNLPFLDLLDAKGKRTVRLFLQDPTQWAQPPEVRVSADDANQVHISVAGTQYGPFSRAAADAAISIESALAASPLIRARILPGGGAPDPNAPNLVNGVGRFQTDPNFAGTQLNDDATGSDLVDLSVADAARFSVDTPAEIVRIPGSDPGGADGLKELTVNHFLCGLQTLESIDEIAILAIPDIMPKFPGTSGPTAQPARQCSLSKPSIPPRAPQAPPDFPPPFSDSEISVLQNALLQQCQMLGDRIAILDSPRVDRPDQVSTDVTPTTAIAWSKALSSPYATCYYPWVLIPDPLQLTGLVRAVPPSAHMAGIYGRVEKKFGVQKPPANEIISGVEDVSFRVNDAIHGLLNDNLVNVIRSFQGRQVRVAGARTTASDDLLRYVNVRRLLIAIERSIRIHTQWIVFEPNNPTLWLRIDRVLRSFLDSLWRAGVLDGTSAEEAYSVVCDASVNLPSETNNGRFTFEIGILPPWPAEFVLVRVGITEGGVEMNAVEAQGV